MERNPLAVEANPAFQLDASSDFSVFAPGLHGVQTRPFNFNAIFRDGKPHTARGVELVSNELFVDFRQMGEDAEAIVFRTIGDNPKGGTPMRQQIGVLSTLGQHPVLEVKDPNGQVAYKLVPVTTSPTQGVAAEAAVFASTPEAKTPMRRIGFQAEEIARGPQANATTLCRIGW